MSGIKGKVIAITGASSGIGEATARLLAQKGAHVVLGARRTDRLESLVSAIRAEGDSAQYRALDVTKREDVEAFVNFAQSEFGKLDVVISDEGAREGMREFRKIAIGPDAIARAIAFAIEQPNDVDVNEIIVRPTASPY